jgi:capsular exopolysaccharide synthesis family protein
VNAENPSGTGWHPLEFLRILRKRRWPFLTALLLSIATAAIISLKTVPEFRASSSVLIERQMPRSGTLRDINDVDTFNQDYYQTQYRILLSRTLTERTMTKLDLWKRPEFAAEKDAAEAFQRRLDVAALRSTRMVAVAYEHPDPKLSSDIVNVLVGEYIADSVNRRVSVLREINRQLQKESEDLLARLEACEKALQDYNQKYQLASIDEKQNVSTRRLDDALASLAKAEEEHAKLLAVADQVAKGNGDVERLFAMKGVLDSKVIQDLFLEEARIKRELADIRNRYKDEHPLVQALLSRLEGTETALQREVTRIVSSITFAVEEAAIRVESARVQLQNRKQEKLDLDRTIAGAEVLKRSRDATKILYDSLLSKIRESEVSSQIEVNSISVVDPAIPPKLPSKPNWKMNLGLGAGAGLLLGIALLALLERIDSTVKSREEIEELLGLPVIGLVPAVEGVPETISLRDAKSSGAEAFRAIRTAVMLSPRNGAAPRRLLVTSSGPGEGKTCSSLNLAAALVQAGKRTLLVDCDFHRPRMHKHLELSNDRGLSDVLVGTGPIGDYVQKVKIGDGALDVITTGPTPPSPSELLGTDRLKERLAEAAAAYDHVILDTPPVCAVTDAAVMAPHADGVILVVQPGLTDRAGARRTVEILAGVGVKPIGVVLNNLPAGDGGYTYYYPKYGKA